MSHVSQQRVKLAQLRVKLFKELNDLKIGSMDESTLESALKKWEPPAPIAEPKADLVPVQSKEPPIDAPINKFLIKTDTPDLTARADNPKGE